MEEVVRRGSIGDPRELPGPAMPQARHSRHLFRLENSSTMHLEIQVALNFVISYMYNKLPRRRVNIFGEELEKALKEKFEGHWYPNKPMKGSAYRCLKTGDPIDPVLEKAAQEAGMEIREIKENLPEDLAVWVDPGEVSYRIGEKGHINILYSEAAESATQEENLDKEVTKTFNPEAQCFKPSPIDLSSSLSNVSISPKSASPYSSSSPTPPFKPRDPSPITAFLPKSTAPLTFTTATFAQTKFGSTKLKTSTKRANRMSPTEFSHYIKFDNSLYHGKIKERLFNIKVCI